MDYQKLAAQAIRQAAPAIRGLIEDGTLSGGDLYVVVALRVTGASGMMPLPVASDSFGDSRLWEHDYRRIANGKAEISARTGLSSREVQAMSPWLLGDSDVKYYGSVVCDQFVVACSGVQPYYDEAIAQIVLTLLLTAIQNERELQRKDLGDTFVLKESAEQRS